MRSKLISERKKLDIKNYEKIWFLNFFYLRIVLDLESNLMNNLILDLELQKDYKFFKVRLLEEKLTGALAIIEEEKE